jgi:hypothetical protein
LYFWGFSLETMASKTAVHGFRTRFEPLPASVTSANAQSRAIDWRTIDPSLSLLEVYRIGRQIPMQDVAAVQVEIQPLLADRRGCQHERPEGRIESFANHTLALLHLLLVRIGRRFARDIVAEGECEVRCVRLGVRVDANTTPRALRAVRSRSPARKSPDRFQFVQGFLSRVGLRGMSKQVDVLVDDRLELPIRRVDEDAFGVPAVVIDGRRSPRHPELVVPYDLLDVGLVEVPAQRPEGHIGRSWQVGPESFVWEDALNGPQ